LIKFRGNTRIRRAAKSGKAIARRQDNGERADALGSENQHAFNIGRCRAAGMQRQVDFAAALMASMFK
jgi:hypothetical protein